MDRNLVFFGLGFSAVIALLLSRKKGEFRIGNADATLFQTNIGSGDGFCRARVLKKRMKGRAFHWHRVGPCRATNGGYFEIRIKNRRSPLVPERPQGIKNIFADVQDWAKPGDIYEYSLWQVLGNGEERELEDPELQMGEI